MNRLQRKSLHRFAERRPRAWQRRPRRLRGRPFERRAAVGQLGEQASRARRIEQRAELGHRLVRRIEQALGLVARLDDQAANRVVVLHLLGLEHEALDVSFGEARRRLHGDVLDAAGAVIARDTLSTPSASMSNATSIFGTPRVPAECR